MFFHLYINMRAAVARFRGRLRKYFFYISGISLRKKACR